MYTYISDFHSLYLIVSHSPIYRYVRHQNVAWVHSDVRGAELSLNHLGVV